MVRTFITSKGQTTVPVEFRREWKSDEILWEKCEDGSVRVRPAPDVMGLFGAAKSAMPRDPREKTRARELMGRGDVANETTAPRGQCGVAVFARRLIGETSKGAVVAVLSVVTVAEIFYALRASYKLARPEVAVLLDDFVRSGAFEVEQEQRLLGALTRVRLANVDFGDAWLAATAVEAGEAVASFDEDFGKFTDLEWVRPK